MTVLKSVVDRHLDHSSDFGRSAESMSQDQSRIFIGLMSTPEDHEFRVLQTAADFWNANSKSSPPLPSATLIALGKLTAFAPDTMIDPRVLLFTTASLSNTPGKAVLWAYALRKFFVDNGGPLTWDKMIDIFPWGFPDEESMSAAWDAQKGGESFGGNLLDQRDSWTC